MYKKVAIVGLFQVQSHNNKLFESLYSIFKHLSVFNRVNDILE